MGQRNGCTARCQRCDSPRALRLAGRPIPSTRRSVGGLGDMPATTGERDTHPLDAGVSARDAQPELPDGLVRRPRLMTRLAEAGRAPLVLLNAPAGFSKSTCLAEWAQADARPFAWLSVSPRH